RRWRGVWGWGGGGRGGGGLGRQCRGGCSAGGQRGLALLEQEGDDGVHLYAFGSLGYDDLADLALVDRLDLHGGLVGLDLTDDLTRLDGVADLDVPLGE